MTRAHLSGTTTGEWDAAYVRTTEHATISPLAPLSAASSTKPAVGRGRPVRLLAGVFAVASLTTAVLSLDATVVLLTPVVFAAAARAGVRAKPHVYACAHLANSASLLLGQAVDRLLPAGSSLPALAGVALAAAVLANLINNLPAVLALLPVAALGRSRAGAGHPDRGEPRPPT